MPKISNTIRAAETPDGGILLDVHQGRMFAVNVVGAKIVALIGEGHDESKIAEEISLEYGADQHLVRRDVIEFIEALHRNQILEPDGVHIT